MDARASTPVTLRFCREVCRPYARWLIPAWSASSALWRHQSGGFIE